MDKEAKKRIFIAINLGERTKKALVDLEKEIQDSLPLEAEGMIKWVSGKNLHLTLVFLGEVAQGKISEIIQAVKGALSGEKNFFLKCRKISYGPPRKMPPRLIWLELEKSNELWRLVEKIKTKLAEREIRGKDGGEHSFLAHITLARLRSWQWRKINPEERPEVGREVNLSFPVKSVEIMESHLKRSGAEYSLVSSIPLEETLEEKEK